MQVQLYNQMASFAKDDKKRVARGERLFFILKSIVL